jgi:hypothetical protein
MPHRRTLLLPATVALALGAAVVPASAAQQPPGLIPTVSKIRFNGIGAFYVGMNRKQAREAAGTVYYTHQRVGSCLYWNFGPPGTPDGPFLRFHSGRLRYVETGTNEFATKRGVKVGDRVRKVRKRYHRLHRRVDLGGGYELVARKGHNRLIFTIVNKRVSAIAGGTAPWALQQECE